MFKSWWRCPKVRLTFWQTFHVAKASRYPGRHRGPFNKTQRGKARRAERRFKLQQRNIAEDNYVFDSAPYLYAVLLHNRKEHYRT